MVLDTQHGVRRFPVVIDIVERTIRPLVGKLPRADFAESGHNVQQTVERLV